MRHLLLRGSTVVVALGIALTGSQAFAQKAVRAGDTRTYFASTPHPYPMGNENRPEVWSDTIESGGATFLRIHFASFDLAPGDFVTIHGPKGRSTGTRGRVLAAPGSSGPSQRAATPRR